LNSRPLAPHASALPDGQKTHCEYWIADPVPICAGLKSGSGARVWVRFPPPAPTAGSVAQSVEHWTFNPLAVGSILRSSTTLSRLVRGFESFSRGPRTLTPLTDCEVEQGCENQRSKAQGRRFKSCPCYHSSAHLVERNLAKVEVASLSLVSRSGF
jgi:hypothetical protein